MNTKVITYGFAFIAVSLAVVLVRQEHTTELTASIPLASNSLQAIPSQSPKGKTPTPTTAPKPMVTFMVTPSVLVTMSPIPMVTPSVSPKPVLVSPSLSPLKSPGIPIKPTVSPSPALLSPSPMVSPTPLLVTPSPQGGASVVINEIAWMGTSTSSTDEWIELYNNTDHIVDLSGWMLRSRTGQSPDPVIALQGTIQPQGYFLLERTDNTAISDVSADQIYTGALNNSPSGELLELLDNQAVIVDSIDNGGQNWYAGENSTKASMERVNSSQKGTISSNWRTYTNTSGNSHDSDGKPILGTPRARNSVTSE